MPQALSLFFHPIHPLLAQSPFYSFLGADFYIIYSLMYQILSRNLRQVRIDIFRFYVTYKAVHVCLAYFGIVFILWFHEVIPNTLLCNNLDPNLDDFCFCYSPQV